MWACRVSAEEVVAGTVGPNRTIATFGTIYRDLVNGKNSSEVVHVDTIECGDITDGRCVAQPALAEGLCLWRGSTEDACTKNIGISTKMAALHWLDSTSKMNSHSSCAPHGPCMVSLLVPVKHAHMLAMLACPTDMCQRQGRGNHSCIVFACMYSSDGPYLMGYIKCRMRQCWPIKRDCCT